MDARGRARAGRLAGILVALAGLVTLGAEGAPPPATVAHPPPIRLLSKVRGNARSSNWAGYAATGSDFTDVQGSWVQPAVSCRGGFSASSFWVGLDGYNSPSVEQIGTDADCNGFLGGGVAHFAWFELYPGDTVNISSVPVRPGDVIAAEVAASGTTFTLSLRNATTGAAFSTTQQSSAPRTSAEWVVEAPAACLLFACRTLPLSNFATTSFSGASARSHGSSGPISTFHNDSITMATRSGAVKAQPSGLSGGGTGFSVAWKHS